LNHEFASVRNLYTIGPTSSDTSDQLKELGLTESLEVGYRLSPRGRVVLERLVGDSR
jgi:hypothetical protein